MLKRWMTVICALVMLNAPAAFAQENMNALDELLATMAQTAEKICRSAALT